MCHTADVLKNLPWLIQGLAYCQIRFYSTIKLYIFMYKRISIIIKRTSNLLGYTRSELVLKLENGAPFFLPTLAEI